MKIRFMCVKHDCDINPEGDEHEIKKLQGAELYLLGSGLAARADGTYEFDFSNFYCPEFSSAFDAYEANMCADSEKELTACEIDAAMDDWCETNRCLHTWTAVIYSNFTPIGGADVPPTPAAPPNTDCCDYNA